VLIWRNNKHDNKSGRNQADDMPHEAVDPNDPDDIDPNPHVGKGGGTKLPFNP
jgi:hypothetical protein